MAVEQIQKNFYENSLDRWIDIHQSVKCCIEKFLAETLMKNDYSRVQFALPDVVFRRRLELVDQGKTGNEDLSPISLNLPYASYYQSSDWEEDDRGATQNASQAILGIYDMSIYRRLRSLACKATYKAQIFFSRRDEVRAAQQILFWEKSPKNPIKLYSTFTWAGKLIAIPSFLTIESINTTPQWNERDFLEKQRIFPIEVEMTVRSYMVVIPNINHIVPLPFRFQNASVPSQNDNEKPIQIRDLTNEDEKVLYATEESVVDFASNKFPQLDFDKNNVDTNNEELKKNADLYYKNKNTSEEELKKLGGSLMNETSQDIVKGYFTETTEVNLDRFWCDTTDTKINFNFIVKPADYKYFEKLKIIIPGRTPIIVDNPEQTSLEVDGFYQNSIYDCILLTYSNTGNVTTFKLKATTKPDSNDDSPTPNKVNKKFPGLIGMNF